MLILAVKLKLIKIEDEAKGTKSFFWKPERAINFLPGQYCYLTLPFLKYPDSRGATRHFTISSSPTEGDLLRVTTRIREESGYKKTLAELPIGAEVEAEGPAGTFTFSKSETGCHIFLAGGIGITPFRSMIKHVSDNSLPLAVYLIYSNSDSDFVFKDEIDATAATHQNVKVQYIATGTQGRLDELEIQKILKGWGCSLKNCTWWVCGPPAMIDAMEKVLGKLKITPDRIRSEKFTGY